MIIKKNAENLNLKSLNVSRSLRYVSAHTFANCWMNSNQFSMACAQLASLKRQRQFGIETVEKSESQGEGQ